ncbi:MAG: copper-binding protein [Candidatus Eremiobacteraeota bacterium]|nr:copper-binding protein [Candidatus Eremiobacteraeota bacterium]
MNARSVLLCALAATLVAATRQPPALRPFEVLLYGTVRTVDARDRLVTIAYAPLDTAPGGIRTMRVRDPASLVDLRRGDPIQAIADTRRRRWVVRDLHRMQ